ncbi:MAG TPA: phosphoribosylanthranilate isomerase [Armatimonadota bacterium]|nr:phosphoribosylanthranilate isomerase [Armatimonadota bacterium]
MSVRVKICGITNVEDALAAVDAGADALGFVFAPSPRQVTPEHAAAILRELPPFVTTVGLVVDQDPFPILEACRMDVVQFHGAEPPDVVARLGRRAMKAFRIRDEADLELLPRYASAGAFLLDAYVQGVAGGTGQQFPWRLAEAAARFGRPVVVAGGLTPENVALCVRTTRPYGVDVSSGVEHVPGKKDPAKIRAFIAAAREASGAGTP